MNQQETPGSLDDFDQYWNEYNQDDKKSKKKTSVSHDKLESVSKDSKESRESIKKKQTKSPQRSIDVQNLDPSTKTTSSQPNDIVSSEQEEQSQKPLPNSSKKKPNAALQAIRKMQELKKAQEEEEARLLALEKQMEQEAQRKKQEEIAILESEHALKRELRKAKNEELRRDGLFQTKSEKERQKHDRLKLSQLQATISSSKIIVPSPKQSDRDTSITSDKKRIVYTVKKSSKKTSEQIPHLEKTSEQVESGILSGHKEDCFEDHVPQSWDSLLSEEEEENSNESKNSHMEILESNISKLDISSSSNSIPEEKVSENKTEAIAPIAQLRSPILCVLGHVDTGKTKLLDKIRETNVQEGEAGGITQQIGATFFPREAILAKTESLGHIDMQLPGFVIIDTPGHASFSNLRSRGSSLCHLSILVVDILHGLEPQTLESIQLLRSRKTPFIVALNKIDRLYGWKTVPNRPFEASLNAQDKLTQQEFFDRLEKTKVAFAEKASLNSELFYKNKSMKSFVSLVPISAVTGEGIPDLLSLIIDLVQTRLFNTLRTDSGESFLATVLEVKVIEGLGTTIDVILSEGRIREGDRFAVCGLNGPIVTNVRSLLTPEPLRESRIKTFHYIHHKYVDACLGVRIVASDLETAIAGSRIRLIQPEEDEAVAILDVDSDMQALLSSVDKSGKGVAVQASTLGSLEALLQFLSDSKIPVASIAIGSVFKKDVLRAAIMLEQDAVEYACMLCFDVRVDKDAQDLADELGVRIFKADIIYHLFDAFTAHMDSLNEQRRKDLAPQAVFPCTLKIVPGCVFNKRDPIILGVEVSEGVLRTNTPLCVVDDSNNIISIGRVSSIELNHRPVNQVRRGGPSVAIKLESASYETKKMVGRHFSEKDLLISKISRSSIDVLKNHFRADMTPEDWMLVKRLKQSLKIS